MQAVAIIGGTGIYDPKVFKEERRISIDTPYGVVKDVFIGRFKDKKLIFLPRHGVEHSVPPHMVNYKANIYALKKLNVERIIATNSVGGINHMLKPKDVVIPHDFIDFSGRHSTFYDKEVVHIDVTQPYCPEIREALIKASREVLGRVFEKGVYACTNGPRFETPSEIKMMKMLGCDIVGMTSYPEVVLARELEICYASICTVTNYAAGMSKRKLTATEVVDIVKENEENLKKIIIRALEYIPEERKCPCKNALEGAKL